MHGLERSLLEHVVSTAQPGNPDSAPRNCGLLESFISPHPSSSPLLLFSSSPLASGHCSYGCFLEQNVPSPRSADMATRRLSTAPVVSSQEPKSGTSGGRRSRRKFRSRYSSRQRSMHLNSSMLVLLLLGFLSHELVNPVASSRQALRTRCDALRWARTATWLRQSQVVHLYNTTRSG